LIYFLVKNIFKNDHYHTYKHSMSFNLKIIKNIKMTFQTCTMCHDIIVVVSGHGGISSGVTNDIRLPPPSKTPPRPHLCKMCCRTPCQRTKHWRFSFIKITIMPTCSFFPTPAYHIDWSDAKWSYILKFTSTSNGFF